MLGVLRQAVPVSAFPLIGRRLVPGSDAHPNVRTAQGAIAVVADVVNAPYVRKGGILESVWLTRRSPRY